MNRTLLWVAIVLAACVAVVSIAQSRDLGQWDAADPAIASWYRTLKQPDNPYVSCCGEADAYWADETKTGPHGETIAVITDDRPDEPLKRPHVPIGTEIVVPQQKRKWDAGNPTGHVVIFLARNGDVYCYVENGGV